MDLAIRTRSIGCFILTPNSGMPASGGTAIFVSFLDQIRVCSNPASYCYPYELVLEFSLVVDGSISG